jgi:SAM-dependent methyltransferase
MKEPRGLELIERYKKNYHIAPEAPISEEMILRHWELEKELTQELLRSSSENRFKVFENCYSKLYSELKWLNECEKKAIPYSIREHDFQIWKTLIGSPLTQKIYEIGSGKAELISFLARNGYSCVATEITRERGKKFSEKNVTWRNSDGVHLGDFEAQESYDVVISDQVIEHIHPDDTQEHFRGVHQILDPHGRYIFRVPHRFTGPHDISRVFGRKKTLGMHLREMTFSEIRTLAKNADFRKLGIVLIDSRKTMIKLFSKDGETSIYQFLFLVIIVEKFIGSIPRGKYRLKAIQVASRLGLFPEIFVVATK